MTVGTEWKAGTTGFGSKGSFEVSTSYSGEWSSSYTEESSVSAQEALEEALQLKLKLQKNQ